MPGGSINQARRRSASDVVESINQTTHENSDDATVTVGFGEVKYTLVVPPPRNEDICIALESRGIGGTRKQKMEVLNYFCAKKIEIIGRLHHSERGIRNQLCHTLCSGNALKRKTLPELSFAIVKMYDLLVIVLRDCNLRNTKSFNDEFTKLEGMYLAGRRAARVNLSAEISKSVVKVSTAEHNRLFLTDGQRPSDPAYWICPMCKHDSIDYPDSNDGIKESNRILQEEYVRRVDDFNKNKNKGVETIGKNGLCSRSFLV